MAKDFGTNQSLENTGILDVFRVFQTEELGQKIRQQPQTIYSAVTKGEKNAPLEEILKDADVMHHAIYNPLWVVIEKERERFDSLKKELSIGM